MRYKQWIAIGCCWLLPVMNASSQEPLNLGVCPFVPATAIEAGFGPLAQALSQYLQRPVVVKTRKTFDSFYQALQNREFDLALIQPFDYVQLDKQTGYQPLVRKAGRLSAQIITTDPGIQTLQDLRQQIIAFPSHRAAVSLLAIRDLQRAGMTTNDYLPRFMGEHSSCLLAMVNGQANACVTVADLREDNTLPKKTHSVYTTESIAHILFVVQPVAVKQVEALQQWFLHLNETDAGRNMLKQAYLDELVPATSDDYDQTAHILE